MLKNTNKNAVFFLSTGRCATQFFADKLFRHYGDWARVMHEPFQEHYRPPHYFSVLKQGGEVELDAKLREHFNSIEATLHEMNYIETGWPAYGLLPYLIRRFAGRVKIVHLFRHPVSVAVSLSSHHVYQRGEWTSNMSITPENSGVLQGRLAGCAWREMDEFCKCLFWWTEINHFALELRRTFADIPWLSLKFEDVFSGRGHEALNRLVDFIGLPPRGEFLDAVADVVDHCALKKDERIDVMQLAKFDETLRVMDALGYEQVTGFSCKTKKQIAHVAFAGMIHKLRSLLAG